MAKIYKDRVAETCAAPGTNAFGLAGALSGFQAFASIAAVGDTFDYAAFAVDANGVPNGAWETGTGTFAAGDTISRVVQESSNNNALVNFGNGTTVVVALTVNAGTIATFGQGGGGGSYSFVQKIALNNAKEIDVTGLDFVNFNYDIEINLQRAAGLSNEEYLYAEFGDTGTPTTWFDNMPHFSAGYGSHQQNAGNGQAQVGYIGNQGTTYMNTTLRLRGSDDALSVVGQYAASAWEMGGTIDHAPPAPSKIGAIRFRTQNDPWTGTARVYKIAKS